MIIIHNFQILKLVQATAGEQSADSDPRQWRGPLIPLAAPHHSHIPFLPSRPGAGLCRSDGSVESLSQKAASEKNVQSSQYFSPSSAKEAGAGPPATGCSSLACPRGLPQLTLSRGQMCFWFPTSQTRVKISNRL